MATDAAKEIYKVRAATVEMVNGNLRMNKGWQQIPLRGIVGARRFAFLGAFAYNILRTFKLGASFG